jgi:hypothetical protein
VSDGRPRRRLIRRAQTRRPAVRQIHRGTAALAARWLPPMASHAAAGQLGAIPITPPLHRDLSAVVAAGHPPTGPAQALLGLLAAGLPGDIR